MEARVVTIATELDIVRVRQAVRDVAVRGRFSLVEQTKLVTAASELARNALVHGGGGEVTVQVEPVGTGTRVRLVFVDHGPGIADLDQALTDGFTTGSGLGLGLGGARRLVDEFHIESAPGRGTTVTISSTSGGAVR
ncbi:serine/threonine-protein kinase RsbT [Streptoalloteichus tenebrarius]|uniref:Serine/threonine-protein kinase RsbT n=2 Tax=Streptoalloteichus tenebrarius (strain ATCC 17920 / DSM 40477 / JCM 4838 / CBS 697.72 / NBRC 16177 / NCIMB 11028 / NRRL B-12390 / A12253. 1 / ISP 5477) TaxID=1933 RepID=A0ABT1HSK3_STRSD|nr:anti-sigma regulatory factor [Streptoalloteichus tenebrarius]MCP2258509.1 serine/threonine-protein kinase RsbT [Streptoalloteichus tenebrarius]